LLTAFDILLIGIAVIIMSAGLASRWSLWREKMRSDAGTTTGNWSGFLGYLLGHQKILKRGGAGTAHMMLFWGFVIPVVVIIIAQFGFSMPKGVALGLSLVEDILGVLLLVGTLYFIVKRLKTDPLAPKRTLLPAIVILVIVVTGFLAEGARLSIAQTGFTAASPAGWVVSMALSASPKVMQLMIRFHFFAVLIFIAILPYTFMRHLAAASLNVAYRKTTGRGQLTKLALNGGPVGAKSVVDLNWKQLMDAEACVSCGRCEENCPAAISGKPLSPRKVIRNILEQMDAVAQNGGSPQPLLADVISGDEMWACSTCMACVEHCPIFIEPMDKIIDMRRYQVMGLGKLPTEAKPMIRDLELFGDAMGRGVAYRADWALNRGVPHVSESGLNPEILLWVGCSGAFHPSYQETSRAMVRILKAGNVSFGILGKDELCCGDPARRLGDEALFQDLAKKNIDRLNHFGVRKIVTLCPHCLNTLKNEYPDLGGEFEVVHATEFVMGLIREKKITLKYPVTQKMAIHDPCYLGRMNQVYEPLREVCRAVPGIQLTELKRNRDTGFCCGGGGGRMWLHESIGRGINQVRSDEVAESGVELVGTACPYCLVMLNDGIGSLEMENPPKVTDIIEIVASSLG
jgi:Fe-S oxidoreductase/nitrate reductase gamma subunit